MNVPTQNFLILKGLSWQPARSTSDNNWLTELLRCRLLAYGEAWGMGIHTTWGVCTAWGHIPIKPIWKSHMRPVFLPRCFGVGVEADKIPHNKKIGFGSV